MATVLGMNTALPTRCGFSTRTQTARLTARPAAPRSMRRTVTVAAGGTPSYPNDWLPKDPVVVGASVAGWVLPSNIGVSALGGKSLFGAFVSSIGQELAHFPTGPALDSNFWLYMVTWHVGLFIALFLGQIGVQARKQGYLD
mmetsp:Transcript_14658/g.44282  ORF Transcript_14658/g.44282 Transcript_14658/m.44282 type:complete len:142 (+) Transcript_14658:84-509(+)|eukprot:CAMPEP_0206134928 /NCGR_PEP_ID=MMETSP1473-20131121/316_1 /ASSEMBLY_ACC=CAM_ASM_001109 /TAXON_ID=1461547 /ORGANISM="Stichococcus sp, Strain RCC1054" /LENGTH=141 /DNA_ID=CAMNT_0053526573 /DNA_START=69 /DNA_END=494 /DNA_ORIENTATION=+